MRLFGRRSRSDREAPTYSNEAVIKRIEADAGVSRDTARTWFNEMILFLDMAADSKKFISPPKAVDAAWHAFILHTRDYEAYCRDRFGRVIHHEPTGAPDPAAYRRAYAHRARYGPVDGAVWVAPAIVAGSDGGGTGDAGWGGGDGDGGGSSCGGGGCGGGGG
jgi:uncharacterized membrane protein YgcG